MTTETSAVIRKPELRKVVPLADATIHRLEKAGKFPRRIQLSPRAVGWLRSEVEAWLQERARGCPAFVCSKAKPEGSK